MRPLQDKIIVERIINENKTPSGIILRNSDEPDRAKVISVGPDVDEVNVDDVVLLNWNAAVKCGEHYAIKIDQVVFIYGE